MDEDSHDFKPVAASSLWPGPQIADSLDRISVAEDRLRDMFAANTASGDPMYTAHFLLWGAGHRTISQCRGFKLMIESRNFTCSGAILRMQLDTVLRLWAGFMFGNLGNFAERVFEGEAVRKLKGSDGLKLHDQTLVNDLSRQFPWIARVYDATSGSIHLSRRHIMLALNVSDDESGTVNMQMGPEDRFVEAAHFHETCEAFAAVTDLVIDLIDRWYNNMRHTGGAGNETR